MRQDQSVRQDPSDLRGRPVYLDRRDLAVLRDQLVRWEQQVCAAFRVLRAIQEDQLDRLGRQVRLRRQGLLDRQVRWDQRVRLDRRVQQV